jgi:hypothetical protein
MSVFAAMFVLPAFAVDLYIPSKVSLRAAGGHFDNYQKEMPCKTGSLSGQLEISDPDFDSKWETAAQIILLAASGRAAVFQIQTVRHANPLEENLVIRSRGQQESRHEDFQKRLEFGAQQSFTISWTSSGDVTVGIAEGIERTVHLDEAISSLEFASSGGATQFSSLSITCAPPTA